MEREVGPRAPRNPDTPPPLVTRELAAEAAVWVARLHGPSRSRAMEQECLAWQARSPAHRHAFERCTETWLEVPSVTVASAFAAGRGAADPEERRRGLGSRSGFGADATRPAGRRLVLGVLGVGLFAVALAYWQPLRQGDRWQTGVGEMHSVLLADGTRLSLNTDTRVRVDITGGARRVHIDRGEALFEVAKDPHRPFTVHAGASEVVALGTVFSVRLMPAGQGGPAALAVTLVEGEVALRPANPAAAAGLAPAQALVMKPGQRVRLATAAGSAAVAAPQVDRPRMDQVMAWKRSEVIFDGLSLADAAAEMNRYSRTPIELASEVAAEAAAQGWRVSGQYRAGDNLGFARAVAALHGLAVRESGGRLLLARESQG
jgi:transmembrane sensor